MAEKTKRKISLKRALLIELVILSVIFAAFFWAELRITQRATEKKLMEKSESVYKGFYKTLDQLDEITRYMGLPCSPRSTPWLITMIIMKV